MHTHTYVHARIGVHTSHGLGRQGVVLIANVNLVSHIPLFLKHQRIYPWSNY